MSKVFGFVILAGVVVLLLRWLLQEIQRTRFALAVDRIEAVAYREYRANQPIDRAAIVRSIVGAESSPWPRVMRSVPADAVKAEETRRRIGSVYLAEKLPACDAAAPPVPSRHAARALKGAR